MQKLIQKHKKLTFEQINPFWSKAIHTIPNTEACELVFHVGKKSHCIADARCCVVGEAHGFPKNGMYYKKDGSRCDRCTKYSITLGSIMYYPPSGRKLRVNRFVNHFNKYHI